jgi:hypothetical protein
VKVPRKVSYPLTLPNLYQNLELLAKVVDQEISFGPDMTNATPSNIADWRAVGNTGVAANTEFTITHNLRDHVPIMFIYFLDQAGDLYAYYGGMTPWTKATNTALGNIYLKCTAANANYRIIIF